MTRNWNNPEDAHMWMYYHPEFNKYMDWNKTQQRHGFWMELTPHMVDPDTLHIENDCSRNTHLRWWIEAGYSAYDIIHGGIMSHHDWDLDCGGDTAEEAIYNLANLVLAKYGDHNEWDDE